MVSSASRRGAASDGLSAASAPPPHPCFYRGRSVGVAGAGILPASRDSRSTPARSRARFASTSSALAHPRGGAARAFARRSLAPCRVPAVARGLAAAALLRCGALRPRGRALHEDQVDPSTTQVLLGEANHVAFAGSKAKKRAFVATEQGAIGALNFNTGEIGVPRAIPDRSLRSRSPAE